MPVNVMLNVPPAPTAPVPETPLIVAVTVPVGVPRIAGYESAPDKVTVFVP